MSATAFCGVIASTRRNQPEGGARFSGHQPYLEAVAITELFSLSKAMVDLFAIDAPADLQEAYHAPLPGQPLPDIEPGDELVIDGVAHTISYVQRWVGEPGSDIDSMVIIVQTNRGE